ncbi:MAG: hypothetical protein FD130_870 [Halothiobacillaceae bacterium]|nr:MAG: hypothetical protein FD130_870 [Halothiobacillaceae bacterium]
MKISREMMYLVWGVALVSLLNHHRLPQVVVVEALLHPRICFTQAV